MARTAILVARLVLQEAQRLLELGAHAGLEVALPRRPGRLELPGAQGQGVAVHGGAHVFGPRALRAGPRRASSWLTVPTSVAGWSNWSRSRWMRAHATGHAASTPQRGPEVI